MKPQYFDLASQGRFKGYDRPDLRWNGWRCPLFPLDTVREIAALTSQWDAEYPDAVEVISIDQDGRVWNTFDGNRVEETPTQTEHGPMYSIGSFGWCWDLLPSIID